MNGTTKIPSLVGLNLPHFSHVDIRSLPLLEPTSDSGSSAAAAACLNTSSSATMSQKRPIENADSQKSKKAHRVASASTAPSLINARAHLNPSMPLSPLMLETLVRFDLLPSDAPPSLSFEALGPYIKNLHFGVKAGSLGRVSRSCHLVAP